MKYLPLIRAGLRRRALNATLAFVCIAIAFLLAGLALGFAAAVPGTNGSVLPAAEAVTALGFVMILTLTTGATSHSVLTRIREFAVLRALGFPVRLILGLLCLECGGICLAGAIVGLGMAEGLSGCLFSLMGKGMALPRPFVPPYLYGSSAVAALAICVLTTALSASRIARPSTATLLSGGSD